MREIERLCPGSTVKIIIPAVATNNKSSLILCCETLGKYSDDAEEKTSAVEGRKYAGKES